jgi:hypothetical protein
MRSSTCCFAKLLTIACVLATLALTNAAQAQSKNRQVGTQYTVTADPLVTRPNEQPCKVQLFTNYQFAFFSETNQNFQLTPTCELSGAVAKSRA